MSNGGYLFSLDSVETLRQYVQHGVYGTKISLNKSFWQTHHALTMADYASMRTGDWVFFFIKRVVYGAGRICNVEPALQPMLCNYPKSYLASVSPTEQVLCPAVVPCEAALGDVRWFITFSPSPNFFTHGLDMDEILQADVHGQVRSLRVFDRLSFIKMEPPEVSVLLDLLSRRNAANPACLDTASIATTHEHIASHAAGHEFDLNSMLTAEMRQDSIRLEAALQAWVVQQLVNGTPSVTSILGNWDFIANQVPASPAKPTIYMDKIDVFGFSYNKVFDVPTIGRFLVLEIKKDVAGVEVIGQVMKYVDWVAHSRAGGDYSVVKAFVLAHGFTEDAVVYARHNGSRQYIVPRRPYPTETWADLQLVRYEVSNEGLCLETVL